MLKPLFAALILLISISAQSQNISLKGVVHSGKYKTPIPSAAVFIEGSRIGILTNSVGEFFISVPDSLIKSNIVVSSKGYSTMSMPIELISAPSIDIYLEEDYSYVEKNNKALGFLNKAVTFVMNDWVPLGNKETNKFDFGRLQTIPTYNPIEGVRLRGGIASNSRLNPHFFIKGYVAYGFKDEKLKYRGEAIYSFNKKAYHDGEYLKNNISLIYENDIFSPGEIHPRAMNDLLLVTYRRSDNETTYRNYAELNYEKEYKTGFRHATWFRKSRLIPQGELQFKNIIAGVSNIERQIYNTEIGVSATWTSKESYIQEKRKKIPTSLTNPLVYLSHSVGLKDFMGGDTYYHRTELSLQKRFPIADIARLDMVAEYVKIWNSVPFPLLAYPNQRHRLNIENNAFFLTRSIEFPTDQQATLRGVFVGENLLFSKSPILNALGFRELISFRATYGSLSKKNNPQFNESLFALPIVSHQYEKGVPYIEGTIGITNILGLLRLEYVHRFTYRKYPDALLGAIRLDIII